MLGLMQNTLSQSSIVLLNNLEKKRQTITSIKLNKMYMSVLYVYSVV